MRGLGFDYEKWKFYTMRHHFGTDRQSKGKGLGASRIVSENKPSEAAVLCEASLEDIYLYYFPTKEGKE